MQIWVGFRCRKFECSLECQEIGSYFLGGDTAMCGMMIDHPRISGTCC